MNIEKIKEELSKTIQESRVLGDTTFIKEPIKEFPTLDDDIYQLLFDFRIDKYCIAPNGGAIVVAHQLSQGFDEYFTALHVYDSFCNLINF